MNTLNVDRLIELLTKAGPTISAIIVLEQFKNEYDRGVIEGEAHAKQMVIDNPVRFGMKRVESRASDGPYPMLDIVETADLTHADLAPFAKHIGCKLDELQQVLDGVKLEVRAKDGQVWRAWDGPRWSASKQYVDYTDRLLFKEQMEKEDRETAAMVAARNEQTVKASAALNAIPAHNTWRNNGK